MGKNQDEQTNNIFNKTSISGAGVRVEAAK